MNTSFARPWLRLEAAAVLLVVVLLYARGGYSWLWFALLFLVPDLSMVGYLAGPRVGALLYNLAHTYAVALLPGVIAWLAADSVWTAHRAIGATLIWCAHIAFDRMLGYGLKSPDGFTITHLGPIGRAARGGKVD